MILLSIRVFIKVFPWFLALPGNESPTSPSASSKFLGAVYATRIDSLNLWFPN